jgi:hypothetical protein
MTLIKKMLNEVTSLLSPSALLKKDGWKKKTLGLAGKDCLRMSQFT